MIKIRLTFIDNEKGIEELNTAIETLKESFNIINKSRIYKGRGGSLYSNIYLDVENK